MTCRDIPTTPVTSYDTLQQMYVGLGIRRLPTGVHLNVDSALPSSGLNLTVLTPEAIACFDTFAGITGGSTYNATALHGNIRDIRALIDYFRGAGNTGDANVITGEEVDAYVHAYAEGLRGDESRNFNAQDYRDLTVSNIQAYVSMVQYLSGGTPAVPTVPTAPAEANAAAIRSFGSVQQMFTGLVGDVAGTGANSARSSVAEDMPAEGIPLGVLNEANIQRFADAIGWNPEADPTTPLGRNAKEILELVDYFRGDGNLPGGDSAVITAAEVDAYVRAYVAAENESGNRTITFDSYRPIVVGNLRAIVACVNHIANPPAVVVAPVDPDAGPRVVAVDGGADAGPAVPPPSVVPDRTASGGWVSEHLGALITGALTALGLGSLATYFVMRNRSGSSTAAARPNAADTRTEADSDRPADTRSDRPSRPPARGAEPRVVADTTAAAPVSGAGTGPRVVADTTGAPTGGGTPSRGTPTVAVPDDIASALAGIDGNASPAGGARPSGTPSIDGVTPENVIISGTTAEPVAGVTPAVVRAQIVLHYRHFLSQAAREALGAGRPLPADGELVASAFSREVNELTDRVIAEYHRMSTADADALRDMWTSGRDDGRPIVRRGVPQRLLMSVVGDYITAEAARAGSPFEGGFGTEVRREAERRAGETDYFERGMREMLRDPVRLGR